MEFTGTSWSPYSRPLLRNALVRSSSVVVAWAMIVTGSVAPDWVS